MWTKSLAHDLCILSQMWQHRGHLYDSDSSRVLYEASSKLANVKHNIYVKNHSLSNLFRRQKSTSPELDKSSLFSRWALLKPAILCHKQDVEIAQWQKSVWRENVINKCHPYASAWHFIKTTHHKEQSKWRALQTTGSSAGSFPSSGSPAKIPRSPPRMTGSSHHPPHSSPRGIRSWLCVWYMTSHNLHLY